MLQKMVGAFYTILSLNYSCDDIIQGIKLNYQESCKKRLGVPYLTPSCGCGFVAVAVAVEFELPVQQKLCF